MEKGKAFILVGNEDWGKSQTLIQLTGNNKIRNIKISGKNIKINRQSNDDISEKEELPYHLIKFVAQSLIRDISYIIITLCPNFENRKRCTLPILEFLKHRYDLYFGVLREKYGSDEVIYKHDIDYLRRYARPNGKLEIFDKQVESNVRSREFKKFIETNI